ncbi:hypothetical protein [Oenococcus kitaharae]|uniref:Uncharacterized protein n=1 Tax=Oenococcus kitaharae DSM 17330 TaxID=1045004 RepID=G9WJ70_9LACO|nr:hypothetical protein [Oenococcus kitaharae]EHN58519.1 hypothetical protein OKIT_0398 [Oenococcus kitaharae DSM 17330]OEY81335.1 hypothetical protein NT95_07375 [Oenococcus kitaharae]OEY82823.1 hypothetical protein NV75_05475 [Oenococcus kitaharae]OEY84633.1 hypothetical protein NT96_05160 [Oenococcus kitaharae]
MFSSLKFEFLKTRKSLSRWIGLSFFVLLPLAVFVYSNEQVHIQRTNYLGQIRNNVNNSYILTITNLKQKLTQEEPGSRAYKQIKKQIQDGVILSRYTQQFLTNFQDNRGQAYLRSAVMLHQQINLYNQKNSGNGLFVNQFNDQHELKLYHHLLKQHLALESERYSSVFPNFLSTYASYFFFLPLVCVASILILAGFLLDKNSSNKYFMVLNSHRQVDWFKSVVLFALIQLFFWTILSFLESAVLSIFFAVPYLKGGQYSWFASTSLNQTKSTVLNQLTGKVIIGVLLSIFLTLLLSLIISHVKGILYSLLLFSGSAGIIYFLSKNSIPYNFFTIMDTQIGQKILSNPKMLFLLAWW